MEPFRGCLTGYNSRVAIFPSKADRIMSRYRPIAPRPTLPCTPEPDKSVSSAITTDNLCITPQVSDAPTSIVPSFSKQKCKRPRKRPIKGADLQEPSKRLATGSVREIKGLSRGSAPNGVKLNVPDDVGFMERAAASVPSSVFPLEKMKANHGYGGCFTEMIRGIVGFPSAAHVHNLHQQQQQQQQRACIFSKVRKMELASKQAVDEAPVQSSATEVRTSVKEELDSDAFWSCFTGESMRENVRERATSEEQQQSGLDEEKSADEEDDGRRRVKTLNLLPESPKRGDSPTISTCSSAYKGLSNANRNSLVYVEEVYGQSSEPVILVDDLSRAVLWVNQGYLKACKDNSDLPASFIDPLGIPTQLGQFQVQVDGQSECISATLWGFLKKLVVDVGDGDVPYRACTPFDSTVKDGCVQTRPLITGLTGYMPQLQSSKGTRMASLVLTSDCLAESRVITPQPIRPVGSVVSLESITEVQSRDIATCSWELVKKQLEGESLPGFITDGLKVVRWVNTAYKAMIRQPECSWLVSTIKSSRNIEPPTITGEVLLSCNVELPISATSFSGRANVQWTRSTGERSCMTVPCDVSNLVDSNTRQRILVWKFDIQASLSLTCGSVVR